MSYGVSNWAAGTAVSQNEYCTRSRLPTYQRGRDVEVELVDSASGRRARGILLRAFGGAFLLYVVLAIPAILAAGAGLASGRDGVVAATGIFAVLANLLPLVWFCLVLFLPRTETLSEWQVLLDGKAPLAPTAYGVIHRALQMRRVPAYIDPVQLKVNFPEKATRSFLRVSLNRYEVIVSVFPFGWDLYLGWVLRRREIPIKVVGRWLRSLLGSGVNYSGLIDLEPVRALREAVHNAMRQGIEAAAEAGAQPQNAVLGDGAPVQPASWQ